MNQHTYLRAYMAGIAFPTAFFLVGVIIFSISHALGAVPVLMERVIVFPVAVIPNAFGLWNMLFQKLHGRWRVPIGLHGAALPFLLAPIGAVFAISFGFLELTSRGLVYFGIIHIPYWYLAFAPLIGITVYYLIWKYVVGFFNRVLGLAY
jgi:hypothetical protein